MGHAPSGEQYEITDGGQRATLVEVGGGIRAYSSDGRAVLDGYGVDEMCGGARGAPLIPWPNRILNGQFTFSGVSHQLSLTEPAHRNAIHGLLRWRNWAPREQSPSSIVLGTVLHPKPGYPFSLDVTITYSVQQNPSEKSQRGLSVTTTATNIGDNPCPYAAGQHPYLVAGENGIDHATLRMPADTWLPTDERGIPTGQRPVADTPFDFRVPRRIGDTRLDNAFTDLHRGEDGLARVELTAPDGTCDRVWADESYPYVQLFTGDTQSPDKRRRSLAVEPMTCPPNGFATGVGIRTLAPGESTTSTWGIQTG
ncbi:aldose 1-epimerase family protein [Pseudonocardia spinosispora]|uniref:aldose 1-epimerase family protein n=1 Tax=Pseudonocardia spinosispora TaxID=103441 RepID=UPI000427424F|nr:aldose 1-epimerase family protein [Pseudonocardia spinosispora]